MNDPAARTSCAGGETVKIGYIDLGSIPPVGPPSANAAAIRIESLGGWLMK